MKKSSLVFILLFIAPGFSAYGQEDIAKDIARLQTEKMPGSRATAALRLGSVKSALVLKPLVAALADPKTSVQKQAAGALGKVCSLSENKALIETVSAAAKLTEAERKAKAQEYENLNKECEDYVLPALIRTAASPDKEVKTRALRALAKTGSLSALPTLLTALNDADPAVRESAAKGLGDIASKVATGDVSRVLQTDTVRLVRLACAEALGEINDSSAIPVLKKVVEQTKAEPKDIYIRLTACASLKRLGDDSGLPVLKETVNHPTSESARVKAIQLLADLNEGSALELIKKAAVSDPSIIVQGIAKAALRSMEIRDDKAGKTADAPASPENTSAE